MLQRMLPITTSGSNTCSKTPAEESRPPEPVLRFSPTAWAKLLFLRDLGDTRGRRLRHRRGRRSALVEDVQLVRQVCTGASVAFDDQAVADFFDRQVDAGRSLPEQFAGSGCTPIRATSAEPSMTDEETFCARLSAGPTGR